MPTMPERMAKLETRMEVVEANTSEIKGDVKQLLSWRDEERGAVAAAKAIHDRAEAARSRRIKQIGVLLTIATIIINVLFKVV